LLSLISQDSDRDQEYTFVEQSGSGRFAARTNILTGTPVIFTTRVIDDTENKRFAEKNRRFINVTPNTSEAKNKAAIELMFKKYGSTPEEYDTQVVSREDKKRAKKIIEIIFEKLRHHSSFLDQKGRETGIKIYFWQSLHYAIPAEDPWSMTVTDRIIMYLSVYAKIRMDFRPRLVNKETGAFYIIPIFEDLKDTFDIMDRGGSNVRFYIAEWYEKVFVPAIKAMNGQPKEILQDGKPIGNESHVGFTSGDLAKLTNEGSKRIRDDFLYPLYNCGLVDCVRSDDDLREKLWFPVNDQDKAFSLFDNNKDKRLKITNPLFYPSINVLEDFSRNSKIYDAERSIENKKNFSEIYKLEDYDGIEITEHELFEKYFSNPEICFIKDFAKYEQNIAAANFKNIQYWSQVVSNQQEKKLFFSDTSPRHIFTEFSKNQIEDSSINAPEWSEAN
jgi:hypothetical protein